MRYLDIEQYKTDMVRVSCQEDAKSPSPSPSIPFTHPFTSEVMEELAWYYEKYLTFPYGEMEDRGKRVAYKNLKEWGEKLFQSVFADNTALENYHQVIAEGWDKCEIRIISDNAKFLNIPWELLYDPNPERKYFLAQQSAGLYRSRPDSPRSKRKETKHKTFNILLIISRPYDEQDVQLRTIAKPMLGALETISDRIRLDILRPATFERLKQVLDEKPGFYHLVHFDGHGVYDPDAAGFHHISGETKGQGFLVFHNQNGPPHFVPAEELGETLAKTPLFVLNACQSAAQSSQDPYGSIAAALLNTGVEAVISMSYSIYALGAKAFMKGFYQCITSGKSISEAMTAGRTDMLNNRLRPSPQGKKPLLDWPIPVLYQQRHIQPLGIFKPDKESNLEQSIQTAAIQIQETQALQGTYGFVGRDNDIARIERGFEENSTVMIRGAAGIGKTSLVRAYTLWRMQTGVIPGGVHWFSFKSRDAVKGFKHMLDTIGNKLAGDQYRTLDEEHKEPALISLLRKHFALIVLDNFETIAGFDKIKPYWEEDDRHRITFFLLKLLKGKTKIIITSRSLKDEQWLGSALLPIKLKGLNEEDQQELTGLIFKKWRINRKNFKKNYLNLLKKLGGYPLASQLILPHLRNQSTTELMKNLSEGKVDFKDATQEDKCSRALFSSLDYSFDHMSENSRKLLPVLGLFYERAARNVLMALWRKNTFIKMFGNLTEKDWTTVLQEAAHVGIIQEIRKDSFIYEMHPVLPGYLKARLLKKTSKHEFHSLEKAWEETYADLSSHLDYYLKSGQGQMAMALAKLEEPNLLHALHLAIKQAKADRTVKAWDRAQFILQYLHDVYDVQNRREENRLLRVEILDSIGWKGAKAQKVKALKLWEYASIAEVNAALDEHRLDKAEQITREMLDFFDSHLSTPKQEKSKAACYERLGNIALKRRDWAEANLV